MALSQLTKNKFKNDLLGILGVSIALSVLFSLGQYQSVKVSFIRFTYTLVITASMWLGNGYITDWLNERLSWVEKPVQRLVWGVISTAVYTSLITILILESLNKLHQLQMSSSDYWGSFWLTVLITLIISLSLHARAFLLNWRQADLDRERLERAHVASQYEALRNQVNPHFLFNSLNVLSELVHQDAELAEKFINGLSRVYRYVLENRENELVTLAEEVSFIKNYLFLHQIRHASALQVNWQLTQEELMLPPMALQLLVENALKHNVLLPERPLKLRIAQQGHQLLVENTLQPRQVPAAGTGTGLEHLQKRYRYLSKQPVKIEADKHHFRVYLPLLTTTPHARTAD